MLACISSDWHYGVLTDGIDRSEDIDKIVHQIIDVAIEQKCKYFFMLGDMFKNNRPLPYLLKYVVKVMNRLEDAKIKSFFLIGNHDVINMEGRKHALEPIQEYMYKYIDIVDTIKLHRDNYIDCLFIPHISKSHSIKYDYEPQEYINAWTKDLYQTYSGNKLYVFSHLNVKGAKSGSEEYMIKGEHENLPQFLKKAKRIKYIFNGHIHKSQILNEKNKIIFPGSVECLNFGERDDNKCFILADL